MAILTLRSTKGAPLTNAELDANFTALNADVASRLLASSNLSDLTNVATARSNLGLGSLALESSLKTVNGQSVLGSGNIQIDGGVTSFNTRTGAVTLGSSDVTTALGYTPANRAGDTFTGDVVINTKLAVGTSITASTNYRFGRGLSGGTSASAFVQNGNVQSDVTTTAVSFNSQANTAAAAFTLTNYFHYYAQQGVIGAGSSITAITGFYADNTLNGATNTYGFRGAVGSGSGRWNLFMDGTASNFLAGGAVLNNALGFGSSSSPSYGTSGQFLKSGGSGAVPTWAALTSSEVTTALGFTPYNSTNPNGYITSAALSSYLPLTGGTLTGASTVSVASWEKWTLETTGVTARARQGSDGNGLNFTSNARWTGSAWAEDDSTRKKFAYIQHLGNGRHEFRSAATGAGISWVTGLTVDEAAVNSLVALQQGGNQVLHAGNFGSYALPLTGGTTTGTTILNSNFRFHLGGETGTSVANFRLNTSSKNLVISAPDTGAVFLNWDHGTGGVNFGNGAQGVVGSVSATGAANFVGAITQNGSQVLHAGNFTSYSEPRIVRGVSSGNWQNFTDEYGEFRVDEVQNFTAGGHSNFPSGVYTYGSVFSWRTNNHSFQLYGSHIGDLAFKTQWNNDNYSGWRIILHSANFNSYALPLSGGTVSGTVRINSQLQVGQNTNGTAYIDAFGGIARFGRDSTSFGLQIDGSHFASFVTGNGTLQLGALNTSWCHFQTDRPRFYFNKSVSVDGDLQRYSDGALYIHSGNYTSYAVNAGAYYGGSTGPLGKRRYRIHPADGTSLNSSIGSAECGFTYGGSGEPAGPFIAFGGLGGNIDYSCQLVGQYNGGGNYFVIRTRNDDAGIWNPWRTIITDGNYTSYAGGLSTTNTWTGANYFTSVNNTGASSGDADLQAWSSGGAGAIMSFHRSGQYAINMGLDSDNVFRIGGWSASANRLQMDMSGNLTMAGNVTAYSDERLKKDWAALPADFVSRLAQVKSGTYTRIDSDERQAGSSPQDWQELLPEVVSVGVDEEQTLALAYGNAALVSAIELAKDSVELRARIERLESLIETLIGDQQ